MYRTSEAPGPNVLGLLLSAKCNISCRHCCNDSHPLHQGAVPFGQVARLIESAQDIPSITEIGFSGGEPFLFVPLLRRAIEFAAHLGFSSSVTTNGFWARRSGALQLLQGLKQIGLRAMHISTSVFHQEFVDLATVSSAANTGLAAGLQVTLNLVTTSTLGPDDLREAVGELADRVRIVVMPCLPAGRGEMDVRDEEFTGGTAAPCGNCREHFKKIAVDRLGNVFPCCSPGGFTPPLLMGNVQATSLRSIIDRSTDNKLLAILESVGPQFFLPFLRAAKGLTPLPDRFSDQCHLCHVMLSSQAYAKTIQAACEQLFTELSETPFAERVVDGDRMVSLSEHARLIAKNA